MIRHCLLNPSGFIARGIEKIIIKGEDSENFAVQISCGVMSRIISLTVFPVFLTLELVFKRIPYLVISIPFRDLNSKEAKEKFDYQVDKVTKFAIGILLSPIGLHTGDAVSGLFLKRFRSDKEIRPFGVEALFGRKVDKVHYPKTKEELQVLVKQAKREGKQISVIGSGMSQGLQTIPSGDKHMVIDTKNLNKILEFGDSHVKVEAGINWEKIQIEADKRGKSVIVKQASDIFSVGGSIGINCHGWAHEYGAISSTVESIEIIDANGELKTLKPSDELFGCMFGTLGYFGIIVSATLKLEDNVPVIEKTTEVELDDFMKHYKSEIKGKDIPLFGGRLNLDNLDGSPLRKVCMVRYEKEKLTSKSPKPFTTPGFKKEALLGTRFERMSLQAIGHLSYYYARRAIRNFWESEKVAMFANKRMTRNEALHPPINSFMALHDSDLHSQWLQEYFISEENLPNFLRYLGAELKANDVRVINATIRPTPKDKISVLPYADKDRYAVVISFAQKKTKKEIEKTKNWITNVTKYLRNSGDVYYQAYMPFATPDLFESCYGKETVENLRKLKQKYDPENRFGNAHTKKFFDKK